MQVLKGLLAGSMNVDKNLRTQMADTKEAIEYNLEQIALGEENERLEAEEKGTWGIVDGDDIVIGQVYLCQVIQFVECIVN